jgi:hypothetical protein
MAKVRVLMLVDDTHEVVASAMSMTAAPQATPHSPVGFSIDPTYPAVPIHPESAKQTSNAMAMGAVAPAAANRLKSGSYVVRGHLDASALASAVRNTLQPDGSPRIFADPDIAGFPTCGGNPPVGDAIDVKRLLGAGRLLQQKMDGSGVALAIVDTGINLAERKRADAKLGHSRELGRFEPPHSGRGACKPRHDVRV